MSLTTLNTQHFSDVELKSMAIAEKMHEIKQTIHDSKTLVELNWLGEGCTQYDNLSYAIEQQVKDIADEFWDIYESLVEADVAFREADQAVATEIESAKSA